MSKCWLSMVSQFMHCIISQFTINIQPLYHVMQSKGISMMMIRYSQWFVVIWYQTMQSIYIYICVIRTAFSMLVFLLLMWLIILNIKHFELTTLNRKRNIHQVAKVFITSFHRHFRMMCLMLQANIYLHPDAMDNFIGKQLIDLK